MLGRSILIALAPALVLAWVTFSFALRTGSTGDTPPFPATGVVFTGQFDRIEKGISLLEEDRIRRLFISGVNRGAGLSPQAFAKQFNLSAVLQHHLTTGRITLAVEAEDTMGNALETSCWLGENAKSGRVLLITSHLHMPRASLALERASGIRVNRLSVGTPDPTPGVLFTSEFWKYVGTWFVTLLPPDMWPARNGVSCKPS